MGKNKKKDNRFGPAGGPYGSQMPHAKAGHAPTNAASESGSPPSAVVTPPSSDVKAISAGDGLENKSMSDLVSIATAESGAVVTPVDSEPTPSGDAAHVAVDESVVVDPDRDSLIEAIVAMRRARAAHQRNSDRALALAQDFESRSEAIDLRAKLVKEREAEAAKLHASLLSKQSELERREAALEAEFPSVIAERWKEFEERQRHERSRLEREISEQRGQIKHDESLLEESRKSIEHARAALNEDRLSLKAGREALAAEKGRLEAQSAGLEELRELALEEARGECREQIDMLMQRIALIEAANESLGSQLDSARERYASLEASLGKSGGISIEELVEQKKALSDRVAELQVELLAKPGAISADLFQRAQERADDLAFENESLKGKLVGLRNSLTVFQISATELETSQRRQQSLERVNKLLVATNEELQKQVDERLDKPSGSSPFLEMKRMDDDANGLGQAVTSHHSPTNLREVVQYARNAMALRSTPLFYDEATVRCFLAGLAMSRLHLLQGISGTGKTSLPRAFAEALGGDADIVAVQAGWRDRQDLLGYYNSFDKKYHETPFVRALYRAQSPKWKNRLCIIVLDEMNLSHVEQFGADLLSELESPRRLGKPALRLVDGQLPSPPKGLVENGMEIPIPDNVWFVGTANHDETTKDFADKTYDRSHMMDLPRNPNRFSPRTDNPWLPLDSNSLLELFAKARREHKAGSDEAKKFFSSVDGELKQKFGLGWGNRLERQIDHFVPVLIASGAPGEVDAGEAVDHLLATKLLRKLRHRHDIKPKDVKAFLGRLDELWTARGWKRSMPEKSTAFLEELLRSKASEDSETSS